MRAYVAVSAALFPPSGSSDIELASLAHSMRYIIFMAPGFSSDSPLTLATAATVRRDLAQLQKPGGLNRPPLPRVVHPKFVDS